MTTNQIKVLAFDAYGTLYDVHSVTAVCEKWFGNGRAFSEIWRTKQLEYAFLREIMGRYRSFWDITRDAMYYAAERQQVQLRPEIEEELLEAYLNLQLYPETASTLEKLSGYHRVVYSNGSRDMLEPLVNNSGINSEIDEIMSMDDIKRFKPAPPAYQYLLEEKGVRRKEVLFMSSNTWDITGAKSFGFQTAWVNRKGIVMDRLNAQPDYIIPDLNGLLEQVQLA